MMTATARTFFENHTGTDCLSIDPLPASGSLRMNFIAENSIRKYIVTFNENIQENESFIYFSELFSRLDIAAPKIISVSEDRTMYLQEFVGEYTLSQIIEKEGLSPEVKTLVKTVINNLADAQVKTAGKVDYTKTFEYRAYNELPITSDLFYFKSFIADILEIPYRKSQLLSEFRELTSEITNLQPQGLMMRDFQSRNIMVGYNGGIYFIDYQAAMEGPLMYDVVSFLFQAKANFPTDFKNEMLQYYWSLWPEDTAEQLRISLKPVQLIRFIQVLGAYGFRGLIQRKPHFMASIHQGIDNLYAFSEEWQGMNHFPELKLLVKALKSVEIQSKINSFLEQNHKKYI